MKGFQYLINAVHNKNNGWKIHLAGDGPYLPQLKKLAKGSKTKIVFHGWVDKKKVIKFSSKAAIYFLTSEKENASISLLEGLASGCAMLTTNSTGCKETVGDAGELVEFGNVAEINKKLNKLIVMNKIYRQKALKRAQRYDLKIMIKRYENELKR